MARSARKIRKKRGSRSCGGGSHKKRRGAGHRGGRGMAGTHKGKWTWVIKYDPDRFGERGFKMPRAVKKSLRTINVGELERLPETKKGKKIDLSGYDKVLGKGKVSAPLEVRANSFTKKAVQKIESAGGKAVPLSRAE